MKLMTKLVLLLAAASCVVPSALASFGHLSSTTGTGAAQRDDGIPDLIPFILFDDFETGEKFGWEAYPYEQDVGTTRHFFTRQSPTYKDSRFALVRPMRANDGVELDHGFTKRINLWTTPETRVRAAIFFQSDRNPDRLEISLGTFDGRRFTHIVHNPEANRWLELDIPVGDFRLDGVALGAGEHIQVVTIKGSYQVVYYLTTYTIVLDDFLISGARQRRFTATSPASTDFEMFDLSILDRHFFYGDTFGLSAAPEEDIPLRQVRGTLLDSKGKVVKDDVEFSRNGTEWANHAIHRLTDRDARGQWEIRLSGETEMGTEVRWGFRFLVPGDPVTGHPRLFFSADELKERLEGEKSPVASRILERALENTAFMDVDIGSINQYVDVAGEALAGGPYGKYSFGFGGFGQWRNPPIALGDVIREGSFRYAFTGDVAAAEKAKEALLKLCGFTQWTPNWMFHTHNWLWYPVGYIIKPVAYGYDMLYDILSEEERQFVREAIMEKGLKLFHRDAVEMNRMPSNVTNHMAVLSAGMGLAATAIYGDDPANPYLEPYLSGILTKAKTFIDRTYYEDGGYGEPTGYMDMASRSLVEIIATFERNFGVEWSTTTDVQHFYKYPLQATHSSDLIHSYGDTGRTYGGFTQLHSSWFIHRTGNPFLYKYMKPHWEAGNGGYMAYLWYRDDIDPISRETLPTSAVFDAQGMVMRSGWEDESTIITTRIGPNSNHYHYDQGTFQIMTNGEELLTDPGIGEGGYYGGMFVVYDIHAIAHNVMLVDHDSESQTPAHYDIGIAALRDWPRMVHTFAGEIADAVEGNLAVVYKGKLDTYARTLLYTKTGPLFLFDRVKSVSPEGHTFNWLFHAPQNEGSTRSIRYGDQRVTIDRPGARLTLDVVSPSVRSSRIHDRHDRRFPESFVTLNSPPSQTDVYFLAAILPEAKPAVGDYGPRPTTTRIDAPGWLGARVERSGAVDLALFRIGNSSGGAVEGFVTDATRFTASFDGAGTLLKAYFEGSKLEGNGLSANSTSPVAGAIALGDSGTDIEIESDRAIELELKVVGRPTSVSLNGSALPTWSHDAETNVLTVPVPEGRNNLSVK